MWSRRWVTLPSSRPATGDNHVGAGITGRVGDHVSRVRLRAFHEGEVSVDSFLAQLLNLVADLRFELVFVARTGYPPPASASDEDLLAVDDDQVSVVTLNPRQAPCERQRLALAGPPTRIRRWPRRSS